MKPKKIINKQGVNAADDELHPGYNEKNPSQPQGAFVSDSVKEGDLNAGKKKSVIKLKKRKEKLSNKK